MRVSAIFLALLIVVPVGAQAAPALQLYIEGATYDSASESWSIAPTGSSSGQPFRLWTIGNVDGPGGKGTISDVRLAISYDQSEVTDPGFGITLSGTQTGGGPGGFNGVTSSLAPSPSRNNIVNTSLGTFDTGGTGVVTNGGTPVLSDGRALPRHGEFGPGVVWQEYSLGDFTGTSDLIGDFINAFPTDLKLGGQINAYDVTVSGGSGVEIHFDLYNSVGARNRAVFAPFSHDAQVVPEPSSLVIWSLIGIGVTCVARRRRVASVRS